MNKNKNQRLSTRNQRIKTDASFLMRCMAGIILTAFLCSGCSRKKHKDPPSHGKPNIIFILSDDMGYGDAQAFNPQSQIPTPNIDRLASEGMRFTDAHAAAPWCLPSRYGLLTGQYPFRRSTGTGWRNHSIIKADQPTLATLLDKRGYRTGIIGKWHEGFNKFSRWIHNGAQGPLNGGPIDRGFDYYYGIPASLDMAPYLYIKNDSAVHPPTDSTAGHHTKGVTAIQGAFWRRGKIAPGFKFSQVLPHLTRKALEFIDRNAHSGYPFFLYFALTAPHTPWVPTKQFQGSSGVGMYGDFCVEVDYEVGRIMKKVAQEGIKDNTILIFSSDNGPVWFKADVKRTGHRGTAMLRGMKMDSWEGGDRIPFIVRWPGKVKADTYSSAPLDFTDMMATFAAASGDTLRAGHNTPHDSYNQLPVWKGKKDSVREVLPVANSITKGHWKLIVNNGLGPLHRRYGTHKDVKGVKGELYNLKWDISEKHNLYKKYLHKVKQLKNLMKSVKNKESDGSKAGNK